MIMRRPRSFAATRRGTPAQDLSDSHGSAREVKRQAQSLRRPPRAGVSDPCTRRVASAPRGRDRRAVLTRAWRGGGSCACRLGRESPMNTTMSRASVEADIKETLGLVPHFFSAIPDELLAPEWQIFKRIELGQTLIPNKYKELIGVGLHAETKCHYCTLFHTEAAKLFGATDEEIQEAVHYAKTSLGWSAYINGMQEDYDGFAAELAQIGQYLQSKG